jgi:hypothetical protein
MYRTTRRYGLQSTVFALDPWTLIRSSIIRRCPEESQSEALSSLEQAQDFYKAATTAGVIASRPLLLYYCLMNLMKSYALTVKRQASFVRAGHGLKERLRESNKELDDAYLLANKSKADGKPMLMLFDELLNTLSGAGLANDMEFDLPKLLPQIVPGHRLWAEATNSNERFIAVHDIGFNEHASTKEIWLTMDIFADDLTRLGVSQSRMLKEGRLAEKFRVVKTPLKQNGRKLIRLEQLKTRKYSQRASDKVPDLVGDIKPYLWTTVNSVPPYRRYYLYLAPVQEHAQVLPQLMSIYAITFYLGSITRYRPHHFDTIVQGSLGHVIEEFVSGQPLQFIYLIASEFAEQEVTKPSIV